MEVFFIREICSLGSVNIANRNLNNIDGLKTKTCLNKNGKFRKLNNSKHKKKQKYKINRHIMNIYKQTNKTLKKLKTFKKYIFFFTNCIMLTLFHNLLLRTGCPKND